MKYKVLINGRNSGLVTDFIQRTDMFFDTLSTSDCWQDINGHFQLFDPQAYVCFVEREYEKTIKQLHTLKTSGSYNGAVVVLIADSDTCDLLEANAGFTADIIIRRPITPDNLALKITRYFEEIAEAKERLKARARAMQAAIEAEQAAFEAKAAEIAENEPEPEAPSSEKKHILIVDDDRTILKMLKSALGEEYEVTTMINGVMIDKFLDAKAIDLIILDYEMPIETGADIFKRVKANPKAAHIPVCFLTGVSEREKIMEVMSLKPHGYLLKPIDMNMLTSTIKNLVG
ncbi:MAG: response regulator [Lachnospiraceae bacterium]|nr:response regulator [Ruminococcus sp.]MCM1274453.1 response regulator [Lachnospiraceae bacterium]